MFGTSCRQEICLSGEDSVTGVCRDDSVGGSGKGASRAGMAPGPDRRVSCAEHRCATLKATIKKKTGRSLMNFTCANANKDFFGTISNRHNSCVKLHGSTGFSPYAFGFGHANVKIQFKNTQAEASATACDTAELEAGLP